MPKKLLGLLAVLTLLLTLPACNNNAQTEGSAGSDFSAPGEEAGQGEALSDTITIVDHTGNTVYATPS